MMKLKYIGSKSDPMELVKGKIYECIGKEKGWYRVIDESGEDYLYPPEEFEVVAKDQVA
ncbi:MAG: hypothetical protein IJR33_04095 [Clostridia bacterium]|nr:hypothetical protein [Clostridia bacterium]